MELFRTTLTTNRYIWIGWIAFIWALFSIAIAIMLSPWFNWVTNALSDLGVYETNFLAALIFNQGLMVSGALMILFSVGFWNVTAQYSLEKLGIFVFAIGGVFLFLIGVFPETVIGVHYAVSVGFFATIPISMWVFTTKWLRVKHTQVLGGLSFTLPFAVIIIWIQPWDGVAIPETLSVALYIIWLLAVTYYVVYSKALPSSKSQKT
ncbi:MAG: DUF998 domain-containing protein [Candidatus Ranarchaeia archaeon]|jgi:hypothetical membrane protein